MKSFYQFYLSNILYVETGKITLFLIFFQGKWTNLKICSDKNYASIEYILKAYLDHFIKLNNSATIICINMK